MFDYSISNPPYQKETQSQTSSRRVTIDIFPEFQKVSTYLAKHTIMIYPATWQKNPNIKLGEFLKNNGIVSSQYYNSNSLFPEIRSGYPLSIVNVCQNYSDNIFINEIERPRSEQVWVDSKKKAILLDKTHDYPKLTNGATHLSKLSNIKDNGLKFSDSIESFVEPVSVYIKKNPGVQSDGGYYFTERQDLEKVLLYPETLNEYTVSIQSSPIGRMRIFNELLENRTSLGARVFGLNETHSLTWIQLKAFDNREEAENFAKYVNTYFFHVLTSFDYSRLGFASYVPDLQDYSNNNPHINWEKPLDEQLYKLFDLTDEEIKVIEEN